MTRRLKRKLMVGVAVLAVLAGATTAIVMAAQPSHHDHRSTLATAAGYLGVSQQQLRSELSSGKSLAQIANSTSGKSSAGLIATLETTEKQQLTAAAASLPTSVTREVDRPRGRRALGKTLLTAASYLGIDAQQLRADERSGKTLAQIADARSGRSSVGLIAALVATRHAAIAAAVNSGTITKAEGARLDSSLLKRMTARVNLKHRARPQHAHPAG
jgi:hypothetical protein